ncbi:depupylase/deamidase Dop [Acidithrix ferrooxidans]|uniref:Depupylase n=1 Tax=Acidithrix ferrooxidans TaxID=1280514 RepID=A0A0D8HFV4_9ACTN|nr:depupylase/deamidase Dop [Acidithrix ferrooxidans]KJF15926.1 depupylase [Acidithrix ferrooxidans]
MAVAKVCGVETEYGIQTVGVADANPITSSSMLVNSYVTQISKRVGWDFDDESPMVDARGFQREFLLGPEVETHLVNTVLTNGARYYVDHAHPEYSSPECLTPREAVVFDKAGEEILRRSMIAASKVLPQGQSIVVYKNNSDRKGNSYGTHENYMMDRNVPFARIVEQVTPYFVTRQIFAGAGKVGTEMSYVPKEQVPFQISQRADFFEEEVGLETTLKRPIVNTRDEPHADATRYRRLHVILGDANMSEFSTWLKVGVTALILAMIEDGALDGIEASLEHPVTTLRTISYDVTLKKVLRLASGKTITALDLQHRYLERAKRYSQSHGLLALGDEVEAKQLLGAWEETLGLLERDPMLAADRLDWVAKYRLVQGYQQRHGLLWDDPKLAAIDLQYHDIRPAKSLFYRLNMENVVSPTEIADAVYEPPKRTRAYFRGKCLEKYGPSVAAANWDSMIFDLGEDPLRRVPMMDPLRGSAEHVDELIRECATAAELIKRLGS